MTFVSLSTLHHGVHYASKFPQVWAAVLTLLAYILARRRRDRRR